MKLNFKFGSAVTVIPAAATEKIISGAATAAETAVLLAIAASPDLETETDAEYYGILAEATGLDVDEIASAIAFWRGASVLGIAGKTKHTAVRTAIAQPTVTAKEPETVDEVAKAEPHVSVPAPAKTEVKETETAPARKALMRGDLPKYDPTTISEICQLHRRITPYP